MIDDARILVNLKYALCLHVCVCVCVCVRARARVCMRVCVREWVVFVYVCVSSMHVGVFLHDLCTYTNM